MFPESSCAEGLVLMQQCSEVGPLGGDWIMKALILPVG
jgi:hypothetical protein